jgi:hypothetical protein
MARKEFAKGIEALFSDIEIESEPIPTPTTTQTRTKKTKEQPVVMDPISLERRCTLIIREDFLEKIKAIAFEERKNIKDVISEALEHHLQRKETEHGDSYIQEALNSYRIRVSKTHTH